MKHLPFSRNRAALAVAAAVSLSLSSCWLPAFDPAVSLSTEMDPFFAEHGISTWRFTYEVELSSEELNPNAEFRPWRDDPAQGGFIIERSETSYRVSQIVPGAPGMWQIGWRYSDFMNMGDRAIIEPHAYLTTNRILLFTDAQQGPQMLDLSLGKQTLMNTGFPLNPLDVLIGVGIWSNSGNSRVLHYLTAETGSDIVEAHWDVLPPGLSFGSLGSYFGLGSLPNKRPGKPGFVFPNDAAALHPYIADLSIDGPEIRRWELPGAVDHKVADPSYPIRKAFHVIGFPNDAALLSEGSLYSEIWDTTGSHHGTITTGAWRYSHEFWDGTRWIVFYSRTLQVGNKEQRKAIIQVEAVPALDLVAYAAE